MVHDTEGHRIYAIGDIHGHIDKLTDVQKNIQNDLASRPHPDPVTIYIGDFIDRGPDSCGVITNLINQQDGPEKNHFLLGNHDLFLRQYLDDPESSVTPRGLHWLNRNLGGLTTLQSYGIDAISENDPQAFHTAALAAIPARHRIFLNSLALYTQIGSYIFVHAGIRPGVVLQEQVQDDLIWIRDPFLLSDVDHGFVVVHGHSPTNEVENHGNRIAIDTAVAFGGALSCIVLEDDNQSILQAEGLLPCSIIDG